MRYNYKVFYSILVVLTLAVILRLIPTVAYGQPFSTDVWPLIRASEIIITTPGVRIWCDQCFDGYNNRWPGVILSSSMLSIALGLEPKYVYCFIHLVAITLAYTILLYALFKKLIGDTPLIVLGLLYFVSMPSLLIFSSSTLKEVYSYPFIFLLLGLAIYAKKSIGSFAIASIVSLALSLSHPLAAVTTIGFMSSMVVVLIILSTLGIIRRSIYHDLMLKLIVLVTTLTTLFIAYYVLYGGGGFRYIVEFGDLTTYLIYTFFVYISYALSNHIGKRRIISTSVVLFAIAMTFVVVVFSITYGISFEKHDIAPYILSATIPLTLLCFLPREVEIAKIFNLGIAFFLSTAIAYTYITKPELAPILHRVVNYISLLNAITISYVVSRNPRIPIRVAVISITITTVILGILCVVGLMLGRDNIMFYWVYRDSEVRGFKDISSLSLEDKKLLGDSKVFYFLKMIRTVDTLSIIDMMYRNSTRCCLNSIAILYRDNFSKGYVTSLTIHNLGRLIGIMHQFNRVYDTGTVVGLEVT